MINVYVDGGLKNNIMYIAVTSNCKGLFMKYSEEIGVGKIHYAEERALVQAVRIIKSLTIDEEVTIHCDLKSLVEIIKSEVIRFKTYKSYPDVKEIKEFFKNKNCKIKWISGKNNPAHHLVQATYIGKFENSIETRFNKNIIKFNSKNDKCNDDILDDLKIV